LSFVELAIINARLSNVQARLSEKKIPILDVLDVGMGWGRLCPFIKVWTKRLTGVNIATEYLFHAKKRGFYDRIIKCDLRKGLPFRDKTFDVSIAIEVLEHLPKHDALLLLSEMERATRHLILISTPNELPLEYHGILEGEKHGIKWETHYSMFGVKELRKLGYKVRGEGFKYWRYRWLEKLWHWLEKKMGLHFYLASTLLTWRIPQISGRLWAWKFLR